MLVRAQAHPDSKSSSSINVSPGVKRQIIVLCTMIQSHGTSSWGGRDGYGRCNCVGQVGLRLEDVGEAIIRIKNGPTRIMVRYL